MLDQLHTLNPRHETPSSVPGNAELPNVSRWHKEEASWASPLCRLNVMEKFTGRELNLLDITNSHASINVSLNNMFMEDNFPEVAAGLMALQEFSKDDLRTP